MAGCSGGSAISVTPGSVVLSLGVLLSVMRASPDYLDGRVASCDGNGNVGEDNDRRTQHPVHGRDFTWGHPVYAARRAVVLPLAGPPRSPPRARAPSLVAHSGNGGARPWLAGPMSCMLNQERLEFYLWRGSW